MGTNKRSSVVVGAASFVVLLLAGVVAADLETIPCRKGGDHCLRCHQTGELDAVQSDATWTCDEHCITCHDHGDTHHAVGQVLEFEAPSGINLTSEGELGCTSCHDLNNDRYSSERWEAESLFGKVFKRKARYQTYYLVQNNRSGQLCKKCH